MNKLVGRVLESDILWIIEHSPDLSDSAIMSFLVYNGITKETAPYV